MVPTSTMLNAIEMRRIANICYRFVYALVGMVSK